MNYIESRPGSSSLHFEQRTEYLYVRMEGCGGNYADQKECWEKIAEEFNRSRSFRLLVEQCSEKALEIPDAFQLSSDIAEMGFEDCKAAYVDSNEENIDVNQFAEVVAVNRGLNCKAFSNIDDAEIWLLSN